MIDHTHVPGRRSWVASAQTHPDFPIQNLPLGVFTPPGGASRGGIAIGDEIFDLAAALEAGLFDGLAQEAAEAASGTTLGPLFALGGPARSALRQRASDLLDAEGKDRGRCERLRSRLLHPAADCRLELPAAIGDYTDFFAGIHHATNAGKLFRPDNPLMPNYKYVPIGYHGRASSISVVGRAGAPPQRPAQAGERNDPDVRALPQSRLRARARGMDRSGQRARHARSPSPRRRGTSPASACSTTGRRATSRPGSISRSARSSARASAPASRHGWSRPRHWRRSARRRQSGRRAIPRCCPTSTMPPTRTNGALDIELEVFLLTPGLAARGLHPTGFRPATPVTCTGRSRNSSPITAAAVATCGRVTCSAPARSPVRATASSAACSRSAPEEGARSSWHPAKAAVFSRTATP